MADVIRNPLLLHCLDQFGITPEEARAVEAGRKIPPPQLDEEYGTLLAQVASTYLDALAPRPLLE